MPFQPRSNKCHLSLGQTNAISASVKHVPFQPSIILTFSNEMQPIYQICKQEVSMNLDCSLQTIDLRQGRCAGLTDTLMCVTLALYRPLARDCIAVVCFALALTSWHQSCFTLIYYITDVWVPRSPSVF